MSFQTRNHILSSLSEADLGAVLPHLTSVDLPRQMIIEAENAAPEHIYFPETLLSSVVALTQKGTQIEVGLYGMDGMSGSCAVHGVDHGPLRTLIQSPGSAFRIATKTLQEAIESHPSMHKVFLQWHQVFAVHVAHTALTNGSHTIDRRLARWLLMCQDRLGVELDITHEFLAAMLGVRRAGVTTSLHLMEGERLLKSTRGHVKIQNRDGLLALAGDAYGTPEAYHEHVMGRPIYVAATSDEDQPGRKIERV